MKTNARPSNTTSRHFALFCEECDFWIGYFGLKGWRVEYAHVKQANDARANIGWRAIGRIAIISLNPKWEDRAAPIADSEIRRCAFHEICELLLARLGMMAGGKLQNNEDAVNEETHNIIRILENTVFEADRHNPVLECGPHKKPSSKE